MKKNNFKKIILIIFSVFVFSSINNILLGNGKIYAEDDITKLEKEYNKAKENTRKKEQELKELEKKNE